MPAQTKGYFQPLIPGECGRLSTEAPEGGYKDAGAVDFYWLSKMPYYEKYLVSACSGPHHLLVVGRICIQRQGSDPYSDRTGGCFLTDRGYQKRGCMIPF